MDMPTKPIVIKRYARSRLYDTVHGRYVTIEDLRLWRRRDIYFVVEDKETGADVAPILLPQRMP